MVQNKKKYTLVISAALILVLMTLLRLAVWGKIIQKKLNEEIASTGWSIDVESSTGSLFGTMHFQDIALSHQEGSQILIKKSSINFGHIASLFGETTFDILSIEGLSTEFDKAWTKMDSSKIGIQSINVPFHVKSFFVSGQIMSAFNEQFHKINLKIGGEFEGGNRPILDSDIFQLSIEENPNMLANLRSLVLGYDGSSFYLNKVMGDILGVSTQGKMIFDYQQYLLTGNMNVSEIKIPEELFNKLPLQNKFSNFSGSFDFESDLKYFSGTIALENNLGLDMMGEFSIERQKQAWAIKKLKLAGEMSQLNMNGIWQAGEEVNCTLNLMNLDLSRWMIDHPSTQLSGLAIVDAGLTKSGSMDQIDLTLEIIESKLFDEGEISIQGQTSYQDSIVSTIDPVMVMVGDSYLTISGEGNFKDNTIDIMAELEQAKIGLVNQFLPGNFISGRATGGLKVQGDFYSPSANAELICNNIQFDDFELKSLEFNSMMSISDSMISGFVDMKAGAGSWRNRFFENGTAYATFRNGEVDIENCHFTSGEDYFQVSGKYDGIDQYSINRLQAVYHNHFLVNARPVTFAFQDSILIVDPFELHINDGMMEGVIVGGDKPEGRFKMSNFDAEILTQFLRDKRFQLSGIIFGEVWLQWVKDGLDIDADLSLKNGRYMDESFDEMTLSFLFNKGMLHMDDISMTRGESMGFQANGILPLGKNHVGKIPISLRSTFSNISLKFIHKFIPKFFTLGGELSGSFHLKGIPATTQFTYDFDVQNGLFDIIELGHVFGNGSYDGRRLIVKKVEATYPDGKITAQGSVPFDFNIDSPSIGRFFEGDSLDFHALAQMGSLPFLTPYIPDLDSVRGEMDISLSLTGPVESIQRSGHIKMKNGKIYTLLTADPATSVEGEAFMNHNQLVIQDLVTTLYHSNGKYPKPKKQNTTLSGSIDFTRFFNPSYDLNLKGKEASFKALYLDIIGQSNVDVTISGRDTITIAGTIESLDANIFYEFTTEEMGTALPQETGTVMSYQLNIPIRGMALFQNSQIDALVTGEMSISQIGHQEMDFGGEIFVEDGSVFSYKDNFKGLQGYVSFDNKGFNPLFDVNAFTMIDDERINLRINGEVDDLDIMLESASGFSESDILELLTWGKRFEDQDLTSTGFGNQTVSVLGSLLENQLEKNLKDSEFGKLGLVDDIAISGAAGLLQGADEDFEVTAKRQIGDKTFLNLSYKRSFSLTNPNQSQIGVEYKLNRHFSVVGNIDEDGNLNLKYRYRYAY